MNAYRVQKLLFHMNTRADTMQRWADDREALLETGDYGARRAGEVHELILTPFAMRSGIVWQGCRKATANPGPTVTEATPP